MMDMLRFRGRSQSSPSPSPKAADSSAAAGGADLSSPGLARNPNPRASSSPRANGAGDSAVSAGPARAIRLAYCDDKGKFKMEAEAVALLQLVKGPIGVVSVCGRARQGKSFVLNQLLGRTSGFQVASTHRPCTKGLWMWSAPLKRTAADGSEYHLVLLDTEGIDAYDQTGKYSTQIFSLAVLLSSMFIYNQMGGIDEAAIDRLSLVTEMTKHIRVRASGGRPTASELGQFSPVFVWLLRDFYLDLTENNRKITPRDYLELALRSVEGGGKDASSKNEIRESIRSLFPDRECFTLVRPVNDEKNLRRLDQIPLDQLRPEFKTGLDELTKFVFERTRPKQVGATVMTGPILVGILQSFLEALNNGAVPTISSSWQSVEEAECRKAYESALELYTSSFDLTVPADEGALREAHEAALQKSLDAYNGNAVGSGSAQISYEKLLHNSLKKSFEEHKRAVFLEADLQCSNYVQNMEKKLREVCCDPNANVESMAKILDNLLAEYESSSHGPSKWKILATFLRQCLDGPISDFLRKKLDQLEYDRSNLELKCRSTEEKLGLIAKQLESSEKHKSEYLKRYEDATSDKQRLSDDLSARIMNLQSKCSTLEERCASLLKDLENVKGESSDWKTRYEECCLYLKAEEDKFKSQKSILESRYNTAEVRLAATREQNMSAQEEALEWKRKYDFAAAEAKTALEKAALIQEKNSKKAQEREDSLREEFDVQMTKKEEEIKKLMEKFEKADILKRTLISDLEAAESKVANHEAEKLSLKNEINDLVAKLESVKAVAAGYENERKMLENEKIHLEEKYLSECKKFDEAENRRKAAEKEAKRAAELADAARAQLATNQREKSEAQHLALERLAVIEKVQRQVDFLEQKKENLITELERIREAEMDAISKVESLEKRVEEREKEIENLLSRSNEQRSHTVQVLENLLATERAAVAEANNRAEVLSMQLQVTQGKLDSLHQEMTSLRLNESALDSKLKSASHGKRHRTSSYLATESVQDMDIDAGVIKGRKRSKSTTSPFKYATTEDGSVFKGEEIPSENQETEETDSEDYSKFTIPKLKRELTKHGFGAELLKLKTPNKKDILALYEKHVLGN